ncbi:MAG: C4-type zinc ribbon domain-containing protein [Spirochaetaceae bacterium]|jgi:predicted  nucleic acid-binding Zn-ribbon protein|nr:C4-type zinc ribbon domain-containing protein [Spirochaetaceae bacterium]
MEMDEIFERLRNLQEILSQKIALEKEIEDIPKLLSTQEEVLVRAKQSFVEKNKDYDARRAEMEDIRNKMLIAEGSREESEKKMDFITTQREYELLDKEIHDAADREAQYRKEYLRIEHIANDLGDEINSQNALIASQEGELAEQRKSVETEINEKRKQIDALAEQERDAGKGIDEEVLFKFDRIIRNKQGKGIVSIKGGVCSGCHMILPVQFANQVHEGKDLVFCPYCSRILYYEESEDTVETFFNEEDQGSLADLEDLDDEFEDDEEDEDETKGIDEEE